MIIIAQGLPGTGKSTLLHDLVRAQAHAQRFFVVDNEFQWGPDGVHWRGQPPPNLWVLYRNSELPEIDELPPTGVFVFRGWDPLKVAELVCLRGHTVYVNDEIDKCAKEKGWDDSPLRDICHEGRHLENERGEYTACHIIGAIRRAQNVHTDLFELADEVYVFRSKGLNTLKRLLQENIIEESDIDLVRELPDFHCLHYPSERLLELYPCGTPRQ